jgi:hypothetical protein
MFMMIVFLVVYFALLSRMKHVVDLKKKYNKALQMPVSQKSINNDIQKDIKQEITDQLLGDYNMDYIHLFERV